MITDIDLAPMNRRCFSDGIRPFADDVFISHHKINYSIEWLHLFSDDGVTRLPEPERRSARVPQIFLPYNVACSKTWGEIFNIQAEKDIPARLIDVYTKYCGKTDEWFIDQIDLRCMLKAWDSKTHRHVFPPPSSPMFRRCLGFNRWTVQHHLNWVFLLGVYLLLKLEVFRDYHMLHLSGDPYLKANKKIIGWLSPKPLPRPLARLQPLGFLMWPCVLFVSGWLNVVSARVRKAKEAVFKGR